MSDDVKLRLFKNGAWDLRKVERRKQSQAITFPDRRRNDERRASLREENQSMGPVSWVDITGIDD